MFIKSFKIPDISVAPAANLKPALSKITWPRSLVEDVKAACKTDDGFTETLAKLGAAKDSALAAYDLAGAKVAAGKGTDEDLKLITETSRDDIAARYNAPAHTAAGAQQAFRNQCVPLYVRALAYVGPKVDEAIAATMARLEAVYSEVGVAFDPHAQPILQNLAAARSYVRASLPKQPRPSCPGPHIMAFIFGELKVDAKAVEPKVETAPAAPSPTLKTAAELAAV